MVVRLPLHKKKLVAPFLFVMVALGVSGNLMVGAWRLVLAGLCCHNALTLYVF
jgi:hypothetical protein